LTYCTNPRKALAILAQVSSSFQDLVVYIDLILRCYTQITVNPQTAAKPMTQVIIEDIAPIVVEKLKQQAVLRERFE